MKRMSVKPFVAEVSTLTSLWRLILPFGIVADIPPASSIRKYKMTFETVFPRYETESVLMLCFIDGTIQPPRSPKTFRNILLDDELRDPAQNTRLIKAEGLHIVTTFE